MISRSSKLILKQFVLTIGYALLLAGPPQLIPQSFAAPAGPGAMGGGPTCPPACPPNPANCDGSLVITPTQALQFGSIAAPSAGTVVIDPGSIRTATGGVVLLTGGVVSAASFSMSTTPYNCTGRNVVIVSVASPVTLTHTTLGATMTLDTFATSLVAGDAFDPAVPLTVGSTLHVGTLQTPGVYAGTVNITVTFQ